MIVTPTGAQKIDIEGGNHLKRLAMIVNNHDVLPENDRPEFPPLDTYIDAIASRSRGQSAMCLVYI